MLSSGAIEWRHSVIRVRYSGVSVRLSTIGDARIVQGAAAFDEKTIGRQKYTTSCIRRSFHIIGPFPFILSLVFDLAESVPNSIQTPKPIQ